MGTVYKPTYPKPLPANAEVITREGDRLARWTDAKRRTLDAARAVLADLEKRAEMVATGRRSSFRPLPARLAPDVTLFEVPTGLIRILNADPARQASPSATTAARPLTSTPCGTPSEPASARPA